MSSRSIRVGPFLIALLCFVMPFLQISCDDKALIRMTGVNLITGVEMKEPMSEETQRISPNPFAIVALVAAILGLVVALAGGKGSSWMEAVMGGCGALALLFLKFRMDADVLSHSSGMPLSVQYLVGFWGAMGSMAAALVLALRRTKGGQS